MIDGNRGESVTTQGGNPDDASYDELWDAADRADVAEPDEGKADSGKDDTPAEQDADGSGAGSDTDSADDNGAAAKAPTAGEADDEIDWSKVDPRYKAAFEAAQQRERSAIGRLSASDRELSRVRRSQGQGGQDQGGGSASAKPMGKARELLETDEIKSFREEFGDYANPVLGVIEALADRVDGVVQTTDDVAQDRQLAAYVAQRQIVLQDHSDFDVVAADTRLVPWLETQPRHIREAAERNWDFVTDGAELSDVVARFKAAHGIGAAKSAAPAEDKGSQKRDRQRSGAKDAGSTGGQASSTQPPDTYDGHWDHFERQERTRQQFGRRG